MDVWRRFVVAQGGDPDAALPTPNETHTVVADADGVLARQEALPFGIAAWRLGAGRARATDPVVHAAGIDLHVKPGDAVRKGDPLWTISADDAARIPRALEALEGAWELAAPGTDVIVPPIVRERIL